MGNLGAEQLSYACRNSHSPFWDQNSCPCEGGHDVWEHLHQGTPIRMARQPRGMVLSGEGDLHSPVWITTVTEEDVNPKLNCCSHNKGQTSFHPLLKCRMACEQCSAFSKKISFLTAYKKKNLKQTNKKPPGRQWGKKGVKGSKCDGKMYVSLPRYINTQPYLLNQNPDVGRHAGSEENNCNLCEEGICSNSL